jgi:hypothetical protein
MAARAVELRLESGARRHFSRCEEPSMLRRKPSRRILSLSESHLAA